MSEVERLKAEWQSLRDEESRLQLEATRLNDELRKVTDRILELNDHWGRYGLIRNARLALDVAEAIERDSSLPRVVWKQEPNWGNKELVVVKATPKRLTVRRIGSPYNVQYERATGMRPGMREDYGIIDVAKTLGTTNG